MGKIENKVEELIGKFFRVVTEDDTEFKLKPKEKHKRELLYCYKQIQEIDSNMTQLKENNALTSEKIKDNNELWKELYDAQQDIIKDILLVSYPAWEDKTDYVEVVMNKYSEELLTEVYMCYGWVDREVIEAIKKKKVEMLKNLKGETVSPKKKQQNNEQQEPEENSTKESIEKKETV